MLLVYPCLLYKSWCWWYAVNGLSHHPLLADFPPPLLCPTSLSVLLAPSQRLIKTGSDREHQRADCRVLIVKAFGRTALPPCLAWPSAGARYHSPPPPPPLKEIERRLPLYLNAPFTWPGDSRSEQHRHALPVCLIARMAQQGRPGRGRPVACLTSSRQKIQIEMLTISSGKNGWPRPMCSTHFCQLCDLPTPPVGKKVPCLSNGFH